MIAIEPLNNEGRARHRCEGCGVVTAPILPTSAGRVFCRCKPKPPAPPGFIEKAINFLNAAATHVGNGLSVVTDEVRAKRLATCQACPLFVDGICSHPKCGCSIKTERAWIDKLSWESSTCPLGKWATSSTHPSADPRPA